MSEVAENLSLKLDPVCNACGQNLIYDNDSSLSQNGFECWYCPDCFWWSDDWQKYPRPTTTA